jgi:cold shock CspA family protein
METGTISRLVPDRGFGFINAVGRPDTFFHLTALVNASFDELREGLRVRFALGMGPTGRIRALAVEVVE